MRSCLAILAWSGLIKGRCPRSQQIPQALLFLWHLSNFEGGRLWRVINRPEERLSQSGCVQFRLFRGLFLNCISSIFSFLLRHYVQKCQPFPQLSNAWCSEHSKRISTSASRA